MSTRNWTEQQNEAIRTCGMGLLVSAAAGSGKTSVLSERCAHLVCSADDRCHVNQLLVVTFTELAAAEMRSRIEQAIRTRAAGSSDPHLLRQLKLVEHAQVSTLHAFCQRLLRQHFNRLELDPDFVILDADEALLLRDDVVRQLFADCYEAAEPAFQKFIDAYGSGRDDQLMDLVVRTHELLCSLVRPERWIDSARERIAEAADLPVEESQLGRSFLSSIRRRLRGIVDEAAAARAEMPAGYEKYVEYLDILGGIANDWLTALESDGYDAMAQAVRSLEAFPRLPTVKGAGAPKVIVQRVQAMLKDDSLRQNLRFSSDDWRKTMAAVQPHADVFLSLVEEFGKRYARAKRAARGIDFSDLERLALELLCEDRQRLSPSEVARACHRQYRHVLVDEYQDINEVQDAILHLVSTECLGNSCPSNLFCVGDVKQSIYRFRLAEPMRFLDREARYRAARPDDRVRVIDLKSNFRSRAPLLKAVNAVFERLMSAEAAEIDYDARHRLEPGAKYPEPSPTAFAGAPIEMHLLPAPSRGGSSDESDDATSEADELDRTDREALLVVRCIRDLLGQTGGTRRTITERQGDTFVERPIEYGDIVILLRALQFKADQFAAMLRRYNIPVHADGGAGFFQAVEVQDMLALLSLLDNQQQDLPMATVLRSPLALTPEPDDALARIRLAYNDPQEAVPFHQAVVRYAEEQDDALAAHLRDFLTRLRAWRDAAIKRPLAEVIWSIYDQTGYLAYVAGLDDGEQRQANLLHLHERARQFGGFQRQGLHRFLQFLQSLREQTELGQPSLASHADNVVRIMSIHGSKGLEFPVVIVPDLGKSMNLRDTQGKILVDRSEFLGMQVIDDQLHVCYPSLGQVVVQDRMQRAARAEELRLLYVAMTRAREHLILIGTCSQKKHDGWVQRWTGHAGRFPADLVLGANCMLDWLGPAAVASSADGAIDMRLHEEAEIEALKAMPRSAAPDRPERADLAALRPLTPPPPADPNATDVIARVTYRYEYSDHCTRPARVSVTDLAHDEEAWGDRKAANGAARRERDTAETSVFGSQIANLRSEIPDRQSETADANSPLPAPSLDRILRLPRCMSADAHLTAVDRGTAVHAALQHLDFARATDAAAIRDQIAALVDRRLLSPAEAEVINVDDILWLIRDSEISPLLASSQADLIREMPFYLAMDHPGCEPASDPMDRLMVRGRIDLVIAEPDGLTIVDYKTDRVTAATIALRAEDYRRQVQLYCRAIENAARRPIKAAALAFLHARQVIHVLGR